MTDAASATRVRKSARRDRGAEIVAALALGTSLAEIARSQKMPRARVEALLSEELHKRWVAPAQDYARLQIARLEPIYARLCQRAQKGELRAVDQILRLFDRLDRYHGFGKALTGKHVYDENARAKLLAKINMNLDRLIPPNGDKA
jgi:hypothetical protein